MDSFFTVDMAFGSDELGIEIIGWVLLKVLLAMRAHQVLECGFGAGEVSVVLSIERHGLGGLVF